MFVSSSLVKPFCDEGRHLLAFDFGLSHMVGRLGSE